MSNTCIALLSNIPKSQSEIIGMVILQAQLTIPNLTIIDFYKDNKLFKILSGEPDVLKTEQWNYNGWKEMYNHYKDILKDFKNVIIFRPPTMRGYKDISDVDLYNGININTRDFNRYQMEYDLMRRNIERILFIKACRNKNVIHLVLDPQEIDLSKIWDFKKYTRIGTVNRSVHTVGPIFEYGMSKTYIQEIPKAQDLYYIASVYTKDREYLRKYVDEINIKFGKRLRGGYRNILSTGSMSKPTKGKVALFDNDSLRDNRVNQNIYYYNLMLSKYTLVNKPYEKDSFNMVRFIEAIICNCVPLIFPDVELQDLKLTYPDIYDIIIKRDLVEDISRINFRIRSYDKDKKVISEIKQTKSYKNLVNENYVKNFYEKVLR